MITLVKRSAVIDNLQHAIAAFIDQTNSNRVGAPRISFSSNVGFEPSSSSKHLHVSVGLTFMVDDDSLVDVDWNAESSIKTLDVNCVEEGV